MFKRLRFAFLLLPILSVGALAGCSAEVGTGSPDEVSAQNAQLSNAPTVGNVEVGTKTVSAVVPQHDSPGQRLKTQSPTPPIDPDQVQNGGTPKDPDPSPWFETPGGSDPDPSPWMHSTDSTQSQVK